MKFECHSNSTFLLGVKAGVEDPAYLIRGFQHSYHALVVIFVFRLCEHVPWTLFTPLAPTSLQKRALC